MKKGIIGIVPVLISFMVIAIITFFVVMPVLNAQLTNQSTSAANMSGYAGTLTVAQQLPLLTIVILVVAVASIIMFVLAKYQR